MKAVNVKSWLLDANKLQYDIECDWLLPEERDLRISEGRCPPVTSTTEASSTSTKQSFLPPWLRQRVKEKEKKPIFSIRTKQTLMSAFSLGGAKMVQIDVDDSHASHDLISGVSLSLTCNQKHFMGPANASEPSVQWYVNSQLAGNRKLDWRVTISTEGVLNIWPLLEDDGGNYECSVGGSVMGTTVINVVSKADAVMNGLLNYMFGAAFYIPITIYVVILVGRDLLKPPVKSKREDKMTAFLEQHMLKNGLEVKENIAKVVYGDKFEERKEEITKSLYAGVGKSGEKLRGNHDTIKTLLCGIKSKEPVAMTSSTIPKNVLKM